MKKLTLSTFLVLASLLVPITSSALEGTVSTVHIQDNGDARVRLAKTAGGETGNILLVGSADAKKAMLATVLSAKATGDTIDLWYGQSGGVYGWTNVIVK